MSIFPGKKSIQNVRASISATKTIYNKPLDKKSNIIRYNWEIILPECRRLKLMGLSFASIGKKLGLPGNAIIYQMNRKTKRLMNRKQKLLELSANMEKIPEDTRTYTQKFFGDPLPGRSALDKLRIKRMK